MTNFDYIVQTPGVVALGGFSSRERAEQYIAWVKEQTTYSMELSVIDRAEDNAKLERRDRTITRIVDGFQELFATE